MKTTDALAGQRMAAKIGREMIFYVTGRDPVKRPVVSLKFRKCAGEDFWVARQFQRQSVAEVSHASTSARDAGIVRALLQERAAAEEKVHARHLVYRYRGRR